MKNIIITIVLLIGAVVVKAQTLYFDQNFNTSNVLSSYVGTPVTANKFNATAVNAPSNMLIFNNKLRVEKLTTSGTNNRVSFVRTTLFNGAPAAGAGLMRFEVEITISNNAADIPSGFMFSVGEITTTNAANPDNVQIHSSFYINPTKNTSEFNVATSTTTSKPFAGARKLIWFINNLGKPTGYMAPDGLLSTVGNDASDIWVIAENGDAVLVVDEEPAVNPDMRLRTMKFSNNAFFQSTIDIDDLKLSEEPQLAAKEIVSVVPVESVIVPIKTAFSRLPFPSEVSVTYDDNTAELIPVRFSEVDKYNMYLVGTYKVLGTLVPKRTAINPRNIVINTEVSTKNNIILTNSFSPNGDGVNDTWVIPELKSYRQVHVEVFDRDGRKMFETLDPAVGWDGKNKNGEVVSGAYFYIITVRDLSLVKKGVLTVIK